MQVDARRKGLSRSGGRKSTFGDHGARGLAAGSCARRSSDRRRVASPRQRARSPPSSAKLELRSEERRLEVLEPNPILDPHAEGLAQPHHPKMQSSDMRNALADLTK